MMYCILLYFRCIATPNSTRRLKYSNIQYIIANRLDEFSLNNPPNNSAIRAYNYSKAEHNSVLICTIETAPILVLICIQHASLTTEHTATAKQGSNSVLDQILDKWYWSIGSIKSNNTYFPKPKIAIVCKSCHLSEHNTTITSPRPPRRQKHSRPWLRQSSSPPSHRLPCRPE